MVRNGRDFMSFFGQVVRNYRTTGALGPSSRRLAGVMTQSIRDFRGPKRILEVGPGTGAFTRQILASLRPGDEFHVVEINPVFCRNLERELLAPFRQANPRTTVRLHQGSIEHAPLEGEFRFIVCGLPFNIFPLQVVSSIFRRMLAVLEPGGELAYFEYVGMKAMKMPLLGSRGRKRLKRRIALGRLLDRRYRGRRRIVIRNFPPAKAVVLSVEGRPRLAS